MAVWIYKVLTENKLGASIKVQRASASLCESRAKKFTQKAPDSGRFLVAQKVQYLIHQFF